MSSVMDATHDFIGMCSEEVVMPMPHHTDVAINSEIELPGVYVEMEIDEMEYTTGEFFKMPAFSQFREVGRWSYGSSNYADGLQYLMREAGWHGSMWVSYTASGAVMLVVGAAIPVLGAPLAVLGGLNIVGGIYTGTMQKDAEMRALEVGHHMEQRRNYGVTNNYTLYGAIHNGYGVFTW
ncbi:MAG: hypothetical protein FWD92_04060 [Methanomassiliicoccaceae archaeon]|nr:hypothetical protein [Methanomassiliicoccaceae archaeon]